MVGGMDTFVTFKGTQSMIPSEKRQTLSHLFVFKAETGKPVTFSRVFFWSKKEAIPNDGGAGKR